ncbi:MAG: SDR family NAD(P)-dependent oxidoreductase [Flavobacteriales bacterium]|nr:SDR family NAD(P)-dependent oxidoreductase [Flavobacteriales bacterium]
MDSIKEHPVILVTGATSGIGEAVVRRFAEAGWRVIITGRRRDRLDALARELNGLNAASALPVRMDVRQRAEVEQALGALPAEWRGIGVLVNNAGLARGLEPFQEGLADDWEEMVDTNLKGLLYVTKAVVPGMVARGSGHVVNIGSTAGKDAYPKGNVYCATKAAVDAFTKALRIDLLAAGIKVTQVAPGAVETEFSQVRFHGDEAKARQVYQGFRPLTAKDVAGVVHYVATLPPHVCINDVVVTPTAQANSNFIDKQ